MRKAVCFITILSILFLLSGCNKKITVEQSAKNIPVYEASLRACLDEYQYQLVETTQEYLDSFSHDISNNDNFLLRQYTVTIDEKTSIVFQIQNAKYDYRETYQVTYRTVADSNNTSNINTELLTRLINAVSKKQIKAQHLKELIYGKKYDADYLVDHNQKYKIETPSFGKEWSIRYQLANDNSELLEFYGTSKQLEG